MKKTLTIVALMLVASAAAAQAVVNYFNKKQGTHTIDHAAQIGLGSKKYELVNLK